MVASLQAWGQGYQCSSKDVTVIHHSSANTSIKEIDCTVVVTQLVQKNPGNPIKERYHFQHEK